MVERPAINYKYQMEFLPGEAVFLFSETERHVFEEEKFQLIMPLIDGIKKTDDIVFYLNGRLPKEIISETISKLNADGFVCESNPEMPVQLSAFWSSLGVKDTTKLIPYLQQGTIGLISPDGLDIKPLQTVLETFGFRVAEPAHLYIVLVNDYLSPGLAGINKELLSKNVPYLIIKPTGISIWIGPLIVPGKTACWQCLEDRLSHNREIESYVIRRKGMPTPIPVARARIYAIEHQAYYIAAIQVARLITQGRNAEIEGVINVYDPIGFQLVKHGVLKRPQCHVCGTSQPDANLELRDILKNIDDGAPSENGYRTHSAEETYAKYAHHVSPVTGIVSAVLPSEYNTIGPIRVYHAGHNFALKNDSLYFIKDGLRSGSMGKGKSEGQAKTSALCEALERFSGIYRGEESKISARYSDIKDKAIHPASCMLYSEKQYKQQEEWLKHGRFNNVPAKFAEDELMEWSPVYSFTKNETKFLPASYLYFGYPCTDYKRASCWADSNGNAAGSSLEDAFLQGLLELVERDSVSFWWYNMLSKPSVNLDSFNEPYFAELKKYYHIRDREFWVLDLTADSGIPVFAAICRRTKGPVEDIILGFGAHLDAKVAVMRAVTEMNQFIPAVLDVNDDGSTNYKYQDKDAINWWTTATLKNQPYLLPDASVPGKTPANYPINQDQQNVPGCLKECISRIERLGLEIVLLNQTRPDVGLDVVKVIVPGMRHFWARFAPGRLFDVPVKMGWLKTPKTEMQLNTTPLFL